LNSSFDQREPSASQFQEIARIVDRFNNFECVQCANAIQEYAIENEISGTRIELFTGDAIGDDSRIFDDSLDLEDAMSENGRHVGIGFYNENKEQVVLDNHHQTPVPREQWLDNLVYRGKLYRGQNFQIKEIHF
jgi:hypothetical protein